MQKGWGQGCSAGICEPLGRKLWTPVVVVVAFRQRKAICPRTGRSRMLNGGHEQLIHTNISPQAKRKVEGFNRRLLYALRHHVLHHPKDCDLFCELLTYGYSCQLYSTSEAILFELTSARNPPTAIEERRPEVEVKEQGNPSVTTKWLNALKHVMSAASESTRKAQKTFKENFGLRVRRSKRLGNTRKLWLCNKRTLCKSQ